MSRLGIISDTHNFFDPKIPKLFAGVDHILHGGDIGLPWIILELEQIAPVTAVLGNTDEAGLGYRPTEILDYDGRKFLVHHIVNPRNLADPPKARIARVRPDVVVFGHTHKPFCETVGRTLYFNPGYAGQSRFGMDRSIAILHCEPQGVRAQYLAL
jgi:putative phosphoesterase